MRQQEHVPPVLAFGVAASCLKDLALARVFLSVTY